jgi:hypothetical protein
MNHNVKSGSVNTLKLKQSSWHTKSKSLRRRLPMQQRQHLLLSNTLFAKMALVIRGHFYLRLKINPVKDRVEPC